MVNPMLRSPNGEVSFELDSKPLGGSIDEVEVSGDGGGIVDRGVVETGRPQPGDVGRGHSGRVAGQFEGVVNQGPLAFLERCGVRIFP